MNKISLVVIAVAIIAVAFFVATSKDKPEYVMMEQESPSPEAMMEKSPAMMEDKKDGTMMEKYTGTVLAGISAPLLDFKKVDYDEALKTDKLIVLYFYANWCPICKAEAPLLEEAFSQLKTDKVIGFRVNYKDDQTDKDEEALAKQFGVPYQHTKVFVKNGERVLKSPESWDTARYLKEINAELAK